VFEFFAGLVDKLAYWRFDFGENYTPGFGDISQRVFPPPFFNQSGGGGPTKTSSVGGFSHDDIEGVPQLRGIFSSPFVAKKQSCEHSPKEGVAITIFRSRVVTVFVCTQPFFKGRAPPTNFRGFHPTTSC